ncbi:MarR family winged helix-turn-helix transcriptional regulator [Macrococcus carouselicus]|nr:MarR family transcriptional regulator [Macrococcus carouselicus]
MNKLNSEWNAVCRHILKGYDITYPQFRVLTGILELQQSNKRITQAQLSQHIGIDVMTLSTIIRNLEARRLLRRQESRSDTRAKNVYLTAVGISLTEEVEPIIDQAAELFFEDYPATLLKVLSKLS